MASPGLGIGVKLAYKSCGQIRREPGRIFEWRQGNEKAPPIRAERNSCIFVLHNATGEKLPLSLSLTSTMGFVKEEVSKLVMIPVSHIRLSWRGHVLEDAKTLVNYGITNGHCIHFSCCRSSTTEADGEPSPRRLMPLTICMVDDSDRPILARLRVLARIYDKVLDVKLLLEAQTGIDAGDMRLTMGGKSLPNESTLIECGVRDESAVLKLICVFGMQDMTSVSLQRNAQLAIPGAGIETLEFPVTVKEIWPEGRCRRVGLTTDSTIRSLKEQVAMWSGIQPEKQILLHRGRVLVDDLTASYYNLEGGTHLDLAVVGGVKPTTHPPLRGTSSSPNKRRTVSNAGHSSESIPTPRAKQTRMKTDRRENEALPQDAAGDEEKHLLNASATAKSTSSLAEIGITEFNDSACHLDVEGELVAPQIESGICVAVTLEPIDLHVPQIGLASESDSIVASAEASNAGIKSSEEEHPKDVRESSTELNIDPCTHPEVVAPEVAIESGAEDAVAQTVEVGQIEVTEGMSTIGAPLEEIDPLNPPISLALLPSETHDIPNPIPAETIKTDEKVISEPNAASTIQRESANEVEAECDPEGLITQSAPPPSMTIETEVGSPKDSIFLEIHGNPGVVEVEESAFTEETAQNEVLLSEDEVPAKLSSVSHLIEDRQETCESHTNAMKDDVASQSSTEVVGMADGSPLLTFAYVAISERVCSHSIFGSGDRRSAVRDAPKVEEINPREFWVMYIKPKLDAQSTVREMVGIAPPGELERSLQRHLDNQKD